MRTLILALPLAGGRHLIVYHPDDAPDPRENGAPLATFALRSFRGTALGDVRDMDYGIDALFSAVCHEMERNLSDPALPPLYAPVAEADYRAYLDLLHRYRTDEATRDAVLVRTAQVCLLRAVYGADHGPLVLAFGKGIVPGKTAIGYAFITRAEILCSIYRGRRSSTGAPRLTERLLARGGERLDKELAEYSAYLMGDTYEADLLDGKHLLVATLGPFYGPLYENGLLDALTVADRRAVIRGAPEVFTKPF